MIAPTPELVRQAVEFVRKWSASDPDGKSQALRHARVLLADNERQHAQLRRAHEALRMSIAQLGLAVRHGVYDDDVYDELCELTGGDCG